MRTQLYTGSILTLAVITAVIFGGCSSDRSVTAPDIPQNDDRDFIVVKSDSLVTVMAERSIADSIEVSTIIEDSPAKNPNINAALASWQDGWRIGYGWDYDNDFYIDYNTRRSCCYRVSYTLALSYALRAANKPLIVYAYRSNVDGSISWRIIIGASVIRFLSPASDWFLRWQAKMQYYA